MVNQRHGLPIHMQMRWTSPLTMPQCILKWGSRQDNGCWRLIGREGPWSPKKQGWELCLMTRRRLAQSTSRQDTVSSVSIDTLSLYGYKFIEKKKTWSIWPNICHFAAEANNAYTSSSVGGSREQQWRRARESQSPITNQSIGKGRCKGEWRAYIDEAYFPLLLSRWKGRHIQGERLNK